MIKKIVIIITCLALTITLCVINATKINTKQIKTRQEVIKSNKIIDNNDDILIAYFSDLHYTNFIDDKFVEKAINKINNYDPDVVIFGGDLIDKYVIESISSDNREFIVNSLKSLNAKYGKYAVFGNHDVDSSWTTDEIEQLLIESGFIVLKNDNVTLNINNNNINIVGINSLWYTEEFFNKAFANIDNNYYTLVVSHYGDLYDNIKNYNFDYMLAAHSHGGQIYFPLISLFNRKEGCQKYYRGKYSKDGRTIDITNGVGRTRYNARFLADSEIVIYRLTSNNPIKDANNN